MENINLISRYEDSKILEQKNIINNLGFMTKAFNMTNSPIIILNGYRQVVYANEFFKNMINRFDDKDILGKRPGELVNCRYFKDTPAGCGTGEACKNCNALNTMLKSLSTNDTVLEEVGIQRSTDLGIETLNMLEYVVPFEVYDNKFYIISFSDITDKVKRRELERIFFHDIINTAGALKSYIGLVKEEVPKEVVPEIEFVEDTFKQLLEEIIAQKQITEAENNELAVDKISLNSLDIVTSVYKLYKNHSLSQNRTIKIGKSCLSQTFKSDYILLKRVLGNMLKNALEASEEGEEIQIGCNIAPDDGGLMFWVKNQKYIPEEIKYHIFERAFSTKGKGRGTGTYSMKLLGERYLGGKVGFETDKIEGTKFYIIIPKED